MRPKTAREVAFTALERGTRGAWSDGTLKRLIREANLDRRESALCSRICYGVQQNRLLLEFWMGCYSKVAVTKLEPAVRIALAMGMYQAALMDRIPQRAAVSESVELVKRFSRNPHSASLTNGILRTFCRNLDHLPQPDSLSVQYSHPQWLVDLFTAELHGEGVEALLAANNAQPPTTVQVNPLKTTAEALTAALTAAGVEVRPHSWAPGCLELRGTGDLESLEAFQKGEFLVQDAAARLAVTAAGVKPGMRVLDLCAAPGGKSFAAAMDMENRGELISCDVQEKKVQLIRRGAQRYGITILTAQVRDGRIFNPEWEQSFDVVLADVPCSGLGIIRKKPDIRTKDPTALENLPAIQAALLQNASRYVKPGGVLVYSTCTVLRRENEAVVEAFLAENPDISAEPLELGGPVGHCERGMVTLWPHLHGTDGFFVARLRRPGALPLNPAQGDFEKSP